MMRSMALALEKHHKAQILDEAIEAAVKVMQHGRLHRYNVVDGETAEAVLLEKEFAAFVGSKYCLAVASGGYAMATALRALDVGQGDAVLTNSFTLAPVPVRTRPSGSGIRPRGRSAGMGGSSAAGNFGAREQTIAYDREAPHFA